MKKSITVTSKTDWTKIKDFFGDFKHIKSLLEDDDQWEELSGYIENFSDNQVDFKDFDISLSEVTGGKFKDITLKGTTLKAESNGPNDFKWVCNNLGSLKFTHDDQSKDNRIKVTIDFKPKFGFAVSMFLKGLFMACPLEELESGIQELVNDVDEGLEEI